MALEFVLATDFEGAELLNSGDELAARADPNRFGVALPFNADAETDAPHGGWFATASEAPIARTAAGRTGANGYRADPADSQAVLQWERRHQYFVQGVTYTSGQELYDNEPAYQAAFPTYADLEAAVADAGYASMDDFLVVFNESNSTDYDNPSIIQSYEGWFRLDALDPSVTTGSVFSGDYLAWLSAPAGVVVHYQQRMRAEFLDGTTDENWSPYYFGSRNSGVELTEPHPSGEVFLRVPTIEYRGDAEGPVKTAIVATITPSTGWFRLSLDVVYTDTYIEERITDPANVSTSNDFVNAVEQWNFSITLENGTELYSATWGQGDREGFAVTYFDSVLAYMKPARAQQYGWSIDDQKVSYWRVENVEDEPEPELFLEPPVARVRFS